MTYSIGLTKNCPVPLLSLSVTPSPFLNDVMKNQVFNKTVFSTMKNFNATINVFYLQ
jgi:hypothetical protein